MYREDWDREFILLLLQAAVLLGLVTNSYCVEPKLGLLSKTIKSRARSGPNMWDTLIQRDQLFIQ